MEGSSFNPSGPSSRGSACHFPGGSCRVVDGGVEICDSKGIPRPVSIAEFDGKLTRLEALQVIPLSGPAQEAFLVLGFAPGRLFIEHYTWSGGDITFTKSYFSKDPQLVRSVTDGRLYSAHLESDQIRLLAGIATEMGRYLYVFGLPTDADEDSSLDLDIERRETLDITRLKFPFLPDLVASGRGPFSSYICGVGQEEKSPCLRLFYPSGDDERKKAADLKLDVVPKSLHFDQNRLVTGQLHLLRVRVVIPGTGISRRSSVVSGFGGKIQLVSNGLLALEISDEWHRFSWDGHQYVPTFLRGPFLASQEREWEDADPTEISWSGGTIKVQTDLLTVQDGDNQAIFRWLPPSGEEIIWLRQISTTNLRPDHLMLVYQSFGDRGGAILLQKDGRHITATHTPLHGRDRDLLRQVQAGMRIGDEWFYATQISEVGGTTTIQLKPFSCRAEDMRPVVVEGTIHKLTSCEVEGRDWLLAQISNNGSHDLMLVDVVNRKAIKGPSINEVMSWEARDGILALGVKGSLTLCDVRLWEAGRGALKPFVVGEEFAGLVRIGSSGNFQLQIGDCWREATISRTESGFSVRVADESLAEQLME